MRLRVVCARKKEHAPSLLSLSLRRVKTKLFHVAMINHDFQEVIWRHARIVAIWSSALDKVVQLGRLREEPKLRSRLHSRLVRYRKTDALLLVARCAKRAPLRSFLL